MNKLNMCNSVLALHNVRIPRSACYDIANDREAATATPVFEFGDLTLYPVLNGEQAPFLLSADEIVSLGGKVSMPADRLVGCEGRKVLFGSNVWRLTHDGVRWQFAAC